MGIMRRVGALEKNRDEEYQKRRNNDNDNTRRGKYNFKASVNSGEEDRPG